MKLNTRDIARLQKFFDRIETQTYPEAPTDLHTGISNKAIDQVLAATGLPLGASILDIGCGQGLALEEFGHRGYSVNGITLNTEDVNVCVSKGYYVLKMDQSFLQYPSETFDLLWCRHCLEHSVMPMFTLAGFHEVLNPRGWLYVEVPAPDTAPRHETNPNHYSVLTQRAWASLFDRSGFEIVDAQNIGIKLDMGPDIYWSFLLRKK